MSIPTMYPRKEASAFRAYINSKLIAMQQNYTLRGIRSAPRNFTTDFSVDVDNDGVQDEYFKVETGDLNLQSSNDMNIKIKYDVPSYTNKITITSGLNERVYINPIMDTPMVYQTGNLLIPTGTIIQFAGVVPVANWLVCDGSLVSKTTYEALYQALGAAASPFGVLGNDFYLPDFRGRMPIGVGQSGVLTNRTLAAVGGEETTTLTASNLPPHQHIYQAPNGTVDAAVSLTTNPAYSSTGSTLTSNGSNNSSLGGTNLTTTPFTNMPPFLAVNYLIKY